MLYDEHYELGKLHGERGTPRHIWGDPHLQEAYDRGYALSRPNLAAYLKEQQMRAAGITRCPFCGGPPDLHVCPGRRHQ